jgi:sugar lactone lactonase YvrE
MNRIANLLLSSAAIALMSVHASAAMSDITTFAGPTLPTSGSMATTQTIGVPEGLAADGAGGFYVSSSTQNRIYHVDSAGTLTVIAGNGSSGFSGDGGPAISAQFNYIHGLAADRAGNLFVADTNNSRIRKISPAGIVTTFAGTGAWGDTGDGGPAASAQLANPRGIEVDESGNVLIADSGNNRIRKVSLSGIITTVAGNGKAGFAGDGGPATAAQLNYPVGVALDASGNIFIVDRSNNRIRRVNGAGIITTLTGGIPGFSGDGGPASSARISDPRGVALDANGNVFVSDSGNNRIRMITPAGGIVTIAGGSPGFSGDGGPASAAQLALPIDLATDGLGNLFIAERGNYRVRRINGAGIIESVAGTSDDGGSALAAQLAFPNAIAVDASGNLYIADTDLQRIRRITPDGVISSVAGSGAAGFGGDGGPALSAQLNYPAGVTADAAGNIFIADTRNHRVRKVTPGGAITTVAGTGSGGFSGDGGRASAAQLNGPRGVFVDAAGNLYIADTDNQRIRKVTTAGTITTVAGTGAAGFSGDGAPAVAAQLRNPVSVAADRSGTLYISDSDNNRIRKVTADGLIHTAAGNGAAGFAGDRGPASSAQVTYPNQIAVDGLGNLFIADTGNGRIREVTPDGIIQSLAGNGQYGFSGDNGPAASAVLALPYGVAIDGLNTLFIGDTFNNRVRRLALSISSITVANSSGVSLTSAGAGPSIQVGYARVQPTPGSMTPAGLAIYGFHRDGFLVSETGVPATAPITAGRIYAEVNPPVDTGLAIANPNGQTATINFFFTDLAGNDIGRGIMTLGPNQQIARFLDEAPFKTFDGPGFQGTFSFTSDMPVGVVAIRGVLNERQDFLMSTLPVIDANVALGSSAVLSHFVDGRGWSSQILLVNPTDSPQNGTLEFRDDNGNLTSVTIGAETSSVFPYSVQPRSSQKVATAGTSDPNLTGSARIIATAGDLAPVPLVIFSYKPGEITAADAGVPSVGGTRFRLYGEATGTNGTPGSIQSGIAVGNTSPAATAVTFEVTNLDGSTTGLPAPVTVQVAGFGHLSRFLGELFPGLPGAFRGVLRVSSVSEISVVGLRIRYNERSEFLITTTPALSERTPQSGTELLLPQFADGGGFTTQFVLFGGSDEAAAGTLLLFRNSGDSWMPALR